MNVAVMAITVCLTIAEILMPSKRHRHRKLWVGAIILLGSLSVVFQYKETQKNAVVQEKNEAVQEEIRASVAKIVNELVAQKRLSPEDGRRLLKLTVKESFVLSDDVKVELKQGQKRKP